MGSCSAVPGCDIIDKTNRPELALKHPLRHLPFGLIVFMILLIGLTDVAIGVGTNVLITLLAPIMWLGWYVLGSEPAGRGE